MRTITPSRTWSLRRQRPPQLWEGQPVRTMRRPGAAAWPDEASRAPSGQPKSRRIGAENTQVPAATLHFRKQRLLGQGSQPACGGLRVPLEQVVKPPPGSLSSVPSMARRCYRRRAIACFERRPQAVRRGCRVGRLGPYRTAASPRAIKLAGERRRHRAGISPGLEVRAKNEQAAVRAIGLQIDTRGQAVAHEERKDIASPLPLACGTKISNR